MQLRRVCFFSVLILLGTVQLPSQTSNAPVAPALPIPTDRLVDSYSIYSSLIPLGETAGNNWPHDLWLVRDTTLTVVPPDQPCLPPPESGQAASSNISMNNPHVAVHAPADQQQDYQELLQDFDRHCHERMMLDSKDWKLSAPIRLLMPSEQKEFQASHFGASADPAIAAKYKGAPALYGFSQVYFNEHHTVALVYATQWCGGRCGQGFWLAFALQNGHWEPLHWNSSSWIS